MDYIRYIPKNSLSRLVGRIVGVKNPSWVAAQARDWFIKRYKINVAEAEHSLEAYPTISELFTRRLKPGARPVHEGIVHPCDGQLTATGQIKGGALVQTKGITYSLNEFLKDDGAAKTFANGTFVTYYLCPTDYHRVHSPVEGTLGQLVHVPGRLWPVNPWSVENISQLFAINERIVFRLDTALGPVAVVMIGATNVGDISVAFDTTVRTNRPEINESQLKTYQPPVQIEKGGELGTFHMGSSVVVVYPEGALKQIPKSGPVRLNESVFS